MAFFVSAARRNAMLDNFTTALNSGYLRIYAGSVPADADAALGGATLLAELPLNATASAAASSGSATFNAITSDSSADATGTASFFRLFASNGTTVIAQGGVSTVGSQLNLSTTSIVAAAIVSCSSFVVSQAST